MYIFIQIYLSLDPAKKARAARVPRCSVFRMNRNTFLSSLVLLFFLLSLFYGNFVMFNLKAGNSTI